ncbi:MAG: aldehyde dehydrogenase [Phycisphaerales bacterium]
MGSRLDVTKTYKLLIGGKFPRSESGRVTPVGGTEETPAAYVCRASRKDLREAVEAAAKAQPGWAGATSYLRGQIMYRLAEMIEGKRDELATALAVAPGGRKKGELEREVACAIDRVMHYAGWCDKYPQVLGCANPVAGPYHNFSVPEATGVVGVVCPDDFPVLGLVSLVAPALCAGNACVVLAGETNPVLACVLAEALATSDLPGGVVNVLTGLREELAPHFSSHSGIDAIHAAGLSDDEARTLREGAAENLKRVTIREVSGHDWLDDEVCEDPWWIEAFVEVKTIWHPSAT